ncbi:acrosomal protein KIAA1210 isoform X3 [Mastacembelus armatus]|uniref:acrosomal protein KIAA1210 isoform X3 n=1 Tax=Mastacembelus armatus TaxID=205130 RepID=UPI000E458D58|nr:acrosomal protein KIAA1210-like isoform X3 [Mastacembelus armatus]
MSWFQSLRDDFTLRPFEIQQTHSDCAAMASGPPDVMANQEPAEVQEECSGKKKSKFQTFKKFFARKKRKEPSATGADAGLKASQSSDNVSKTSENNTITRSEKDKGSGSKINLGSKALSHDSVFVSDSSEANEGLGASQDSIHGKVKLLQLQLKQAIRLGSPPSLMCVKRTEDAGTMSEDDGLPCSPPEYTAVQAVMNEAQRNSSISLEGIDGDDDQNSCAVSSGAVSPLVVPGDFSQPASPFSCLDNTAAKHKLGLRHKACNKRKPASRLEVKSEGDSVVGEMLNTFTTEALGEEHEQKADVVRFDEVKLKVEIEEEAEDEEKVQPQHSGQSLLRDNEEMKEGEDKSEAEQDVSHDLDTSPPDQGLSEEEVPYAQSLPSSKSSSRASSLDSPRATESPAIPREYLMDPPDIASGAEENRVETDLVLTGEEDSEERNREEESSLLQEVLSSLKTPLVTCLLNAETEGVGLTMEDEMNKKQREEVETEGGAELKEEEAEVDEPVSFQATYPGSLLLGHTTEEEELVTLSCQEEEKVVAVEEEVKGQEAKEQEEEEEKEEAEEVKPQEENDLVCRKTNVQEEEEEYQSEGEEEAIELEEEPEVEEEGREKTEDDDEEEVVKEVKENLEEAEEATEEEKDDAEEMTEWFDGAAVEDVQVAMPLLEADEGMDVVVRDDTIKHTDDSEIPTELDEEEFTTVRECQANYNQTPEDEWEGEEEREEGVVEIKHTKHEAEQEKEANQPSPGYTEQDVELGEDHTEATEKAVVSSKPPALSLPEPHFETQSQESGTITPSKTSTIHINLMYPSPEKVTSFFQQPQTAAEPIEHEPLSDAEEQISASKEPSDSVEEDSAQEEEATPSVFVEETINQPSRSSDQSEVRFAITPAWQRSHSLTPPSSPPVCGSSPSNALGSGGEELEATGKKDPAVKAEPAGSAKVELVLSPGSAGNAGRTTAKPQNKTSLSPNPVKPQLSAAANTEESSIIVEGNPDNPFGVRLRKTSVQHRFSSEEENAECPVDPPIQPISCKAEPLQPASVKPFQSQSISNKPTLPKKPDVHGDSGGKSKHISDSAADHGVSGGSESPSWISVARQKQKIYKEISPDEITVKKEEQERKSSPPIYVSSAASREQSSHTAQSANKVNPLEMNKLATNVEKDVRKTLPPPTPVPLQSSKSQLLPSPVPPKIQVLPVTVKPVSHPNPATRSLYPPTPVPVTQNHPSCTSPSSVSKTPASLLSSKTPESQTVRHTHILRNVKIPGQRLKWDGIQMKLDNSVLNKPLPVVTFGKGDLIESDLLGTDHVIKTSFDGKAQTCCDLQYLTVHGLKEVLKLYPEYGNVYASNINNSLTYNLHLCHQNEDSCILHEGSKGKVLPQQFWRFHRDLLSGRQGRRVQGTVHPDASIFSLNIR